MRLILSLALLVGLAAPAGAQVAFPNAAGRDVVQKGLGTGLKVILPGSSEEIPLQDLVKNAPTVGTDCAVALRGGPRLGCYQGGKYVSQPDGLAVGSVPTYQAGLQPDIAVSLGGTYGFESLAAPTAFARFRASGRGGGYLHYSAVGNPSLTSIAGAFAGTGPGVIEVSYGGGFNTGFWGRADYQQKVVAKGFRPAAAIVNIDTSAAQFSTRWSDSAGFKAFVDAARRDGGVKVLAPIASPNQSGGPGAAGDAATVAVIHPWSDPWWDDVKAAALYGGGIALDSPPKFYFEGLPNPVQQAAYQQATKDIIAWGHANNLWVAVLVSPYTEQTFEAFARRFYEALHAADRLPSHWAVVNYNACGRASGFPTDCQPGDAAYYSPVGTESTANSQAAVALWYARHARVRPYAGTYAGMIGRPSAQVAPARIAGRDGADQRINLADVDGAGTAAAQSAEAPVFGSATMDAATVNGPATFGGFFGIGAPPGLHRMINPEYMGIGGNVGTGGLIIGGGRADQGYQGTIFSNDGHPNWTKAVSSQNYNPTEFIVGGAGAQGWASASGGNNTITRIDGTTFDPAWIGRRFYFAHTAYRVTAVAAGGGSLTVAAADGAATTVPATARDVFQFVMTTGEGTANVVNGVVSWVSGTPFPLYTTPDVDFVITIGGKDYRTATSQGSYRLTLADATVNGTGVAFRYALNINDQVAALRVGKLNGGIEETATLSGRATDGQGRGEWEWRFGSLTENTDPDPVRFKVGRRDGQALSQIDIRGDGLSLGGLRGAEGLRVVNLPGTVNRVEVQGAVTGGSPTLSARGADPNVNLTLSPQGNGSVVMTGPTVTSAITLNALAGQFRTQYFQSNGANRWTIFADNNAETGNNAGSNFNIGRWSDAGAPIANALSIDRASGKTTLSSLNVTGGIDGFRTQGTGDGVWAFGRTRTKPGQGLCIGGGVPSEGSNCTLLGLDGHSNWARVSTSRNYNPTEWLIYSAFAQGRVVTVAGTNRVKWMKTAKFETNGDWARRKFYLGNRVFYIQSVIDDQNIALKNLDGSIPTFPDGAAYTYMVGYTSGEGTLSISGKTVRRLYGDPFIPFTRYGAPDEGIEIGGQLYWMASVTDNGDTAVLDRAPGDAASAAYKFYGNINDQATTIRIQKVAGEDEENVSLFSNYEGYHIKGFQSGVGEFWPIFMGTSGGGGRLYEQLVLNVDGSTSIGDRPGGDSLRVYNGSAPGQAAANRLEVTGAYAGFGPSLRGRGKDTNVGIGFDTQGAGEVVFTGNTFRQILFKMYGTTGTGNLAFPAVFNQTTFTGLQAQGPAPNIDIGLTPQGTGSVIMGGSARLKSYAYSQLSGLDATPGGSVYCSDCREPGQAAGAGTGIPVFRNASGWRSAVGGGAAAN